MSVIVMGMEMSDTDGEYIEGLCCDCIMQGPCCSWDENESCPRYKDDGSCWVSANYDNPELLEGD